MQPSIILIGHRSSGKSVLGKALSRSLGLPFFDIDILVEKECGEPAGLLAARDEVDFRRRELETLGSVLREHPGSVVTPGAGIQQIPDGHYVIWLFREGWIESAAAHRQRLKPELSFEEEIRWMQKTRENRYCAAAHYRLHIERDCGEQEAAERLLLIARWLMGTRQSPASRKCWMVPRTDSDLARCQADADLFGLGGVEIRSDRFDTLPESDIPLMASLRTVDRGFFRRCSGASVFDCDVTLLDTMQLDGLEPRPLLLSAHPSDVFREYFMELIEARASVARRYPEWEAHIHFKFAPLVKSWVELRFAFQLVNYYQRSIPRFTFLPQGKPWRWMRALRLHEHNEFNYVSPGCDLASQAPPGIEYFLPLLTSPAPEAYYGIIGAPVDQSRGDVFHRQASLIEDQGSSAYVKIPVPTVELDNALHLLPTLGIRGLSVTSPLKRVVAESNFVGSTAGLKSGNTLALIKGSFLLYDTDEAGMRASLREVERAGATKGPVALFGAGGVMPAVLRALEAEGWGPVVSVPARDGWVDNANDIFSLVVDASGPGGASRIAPPVAKAWIDLHYRDLAPPPPGVEVYLGGTTFFMAQAMAQREIWKKGDAMLDVTP